jgi:fatty acid-binding protein DegV
VNVRIVTDSTAYLPVDLVRQHAIEVVPLHVVVGGADHIEGEGVTADEGARAVREYTIVTSSRPTPQAFLDSYRRLAADLRTMVPEAREVRVVELGAVVGAHVGPSTLAISVSPRPGEVAEHALHDQDDA